MWPLWWLIPVILELSSLYSVNDGMARGKYKVWKLLLCNMRKINNLGFEKDFDVKIIHGMKIIAFPA